MKIKLETDDILNLSGSISLYNGLVTGYDELIVSDRKESSPPYDGITFKMRPSDATSPWLLTITPGSSALEKFYLLENNTGRQYYLICFKGKIVAGYIEDKLSKIEIDVPGCMLVEYSPKNNFFVCAGLFDFAYFSPGTTPVYTSYDVDVESIRFVDERYLEVHTFDQIRGPEILKYEVGHSTIRAS